MRRSAWYGPLLIVTVLANLGDPVAGQVVVGDVSDAGNGGAIEGVRLELIDVDGRVVASTDSDPLGRFVLMPERAGRYSVFAERLGYTSVRSGVFGVMEGSPVVVELQLDVEAIPLSPVVVLAGGQIRSAAMAGFEQRRNDPTLGGHFLDAADIRARPMATPTQLLRQLPSVHLYQVMTQDNPTGMDRSLIYLSGSGAISLISGMCLAQVYINGVPARQTQDGDFTIDDYLDGVPIAGIELYPRASAAPFQYRGTGECGVVLFWIEEPAPSSDGWGLKRIAAGVGMIVGMLIVGFSR